MDNGVSVFSQPRPPVISGARTRVFSCTDIRTPFSGASDWAPKSETVVITATTRRRAGICLMFNGGGAPHFDLWSLAFSLWSWVLGIGLWVQISLKTKDQR